MKIGFFADEYLPRVDGVITSMINSAKGLEGLGHEVIFVVPAYPGAKAARNVIRVPSTPIPLSDNVRSMLPNRRVRKLIKDLDLDIIHSHTPFAAAQIARRASAELDVPHLSTFHTLLPVLLDYYPLRTRTYFPAIAAAIADVLYAADLAKYAVPETDQDSRFKRQAWKWTGAFIDSVNHVISPSEHFAKLLEGLRANTPISVVPNALDLEAFDEPDYTPGFPLKLAAVGRLSPEKRQYELIQAMAQLDPRKFKLEIVGDGPDRKRLAVRLAELDLPHVELKGPLQPHEVRKFLKQCDAGLLASHGFDNQPMTILEYLASGLPVIYCDPQLTEGLDPSNSVLSPPDPSAIAGTLDALNIPQLQQMSKAARQASLAFSVETNAQALEKVYEAVLS